MTGKDPKQTTQIVIDAVNKTKVRAIIATGWGGLEATDLPDHILAIEGAPHDWLFARVAAVVHHGGAGTTAAGLKAGKPTLICPFFGDQPFWGALIAKRGLGPVPIKQKQLNSENLSSALLELVSNEQYLAQAQKVASQLALEDGPERAIKWLEHRADKADELRVYQNAVRLISI